MEYRILDAAEINKRLFLNFERRQEVTRCWRKIKDKWIIHDVIFIDQWGDDEYTTLIKCLKNTKDTGGVVFGAFFNSQLKGFSSVESNFFGKNKEYLDLSNIHVSEDVRRKNIGKELFKMACTWAKMHGAKKLYLSAHSAVESQAFYNSIGCIEAIEYSQEHVQKEPYDCQLEYLLS